MCCVTLPCLFDLAFFFPSHHSLKHARAYNSANLWLTYMYMCTCTCTCVYMFLNERCRRKKEASKVKQTNKAKQHSTPKAVTFPRKNELPRVGLEPTTLYTLDRALYQLSSAGCAQISHLIVHLMNRLTINSV